MTPATSPPTTAPPEDPVGLALADPNTRDQLLTHALSILCQRLADKPYSVRRDEAEDIVQNTCSVALRRRADYEPTVGTVAGWLHGILVRTAYAQCRSVRNQSPQSADPAVWENLTANRLVPSTSPDAMLDLPVYLARLSPEQRALLEMRYREGLEFDEIADRLGISVGAARVRFCRTLAAVREAAGQSLMGERP